MSAWSSTWATASAAAAAGSLADLRQTPNGAACPVYAVMGNHDLEWLDKRQFCRAFAEPAPHPFAVAGQHGRLLLPDANFNETGQDTCGPGWVWRESYLEPSTTAWLETELASGDPAVNLICIHQNLDNRRTADQDNPHGGRNAAAVRLILGQSWRRVYRPAGRR